MSAERPDNVQPNALAHDGVDPVLEARVSHRLARHLPVASRKRQDAAPMVSFTFDDVPQSAAEAGAAILEEHGARGTYYIAGGLLGRQTQHWRVIGPDVIPALFARGHEIGCHTFSHRRADRVAAAEAMADIARNHALLREIEPALRLDNFAYPFGLTSFGWKRRLAKLFRSCRAIQPGINAGRIDPQFLCALPLADSRIDDAAIARLMDETIAGNGWLVFYGHDVTAEPSEFGCRPQLLRMALRAAAARGLELATIAGALDRLEAAAG